MQEKELTKYDYLDLIYEEPYKIGQWLGFNLLTEVHNDWLKDMIFGEGDETLLAHRGSYKTTCLSIAFTLIMIIFPNDNIIFTRKTDDDVKEIIKQTAKMLKSSVIKYIVYKIYGVELKLIEENAFSITTNLVTSSMGASQLLGAGIKTSLTGKHAKRIFTDDIVNVKDRVSKAERDIIKLQYQELQNIKNRDGRIFNTGTKWHKEDAIEVLMPNKKIFDCYSTGLIPRDKIEEIRQSMTPSLFCANYELKHIADGDALFDNPTFTNEEHLIHNGVCHIDAAYGGEDGSVLTIIKDMGDKLIVLGKRRNKHIDDCLDDFLTIKRHYLGGSIDCEDNGDKGYLAKEIRNKGDIANTYHEDMNKYIKISTYLKKWWKNIVFLEDTDPDYINEILDYTENAEHDDSPDSLASIIRRLKGKSKWLY
jgi:hypothetical protein